MKCPNCDEASDQDVCEYCGTQILSEAEDTMDQLVQAASIPNLAALFQQGKDRGLLKPAQDYGGGV